MAKFRVGSRVKLTDDAIANYGEQYRDRVFRITHVATKQGWGKGHTLDMIPV